jgi:guanylate kinase
MRTGESEGHPYFFLEESRFRDLIAQGHFVEWAEVHGKLYGVPESQLHEVWAQNCAVIMDIDIQGARTLMSKYKQSRCIFITPPSIEALRQRVIKREGKVPPDLDLRMENAKREMSLAHGFEFQVTNENFDNCYRDIQKIIDETLGLH